MSASSTDHQADVEIEMGKPRKKGDGASQLGWVKELYVTVLCV